MKAKFLNFLLILLILPAVSVFALGEDDPIGDDIGGDATLKIVSESYEGVAGNSDSYAPSISANGRLIAFQSAADNLVPGDTNGLQDIFVYDFYTKLIERVSLTDDQLEANGASRRPVISADGSAIAFESQATNLVANDRDAEWDVYRIDLRNRTISLASSGLQGAMSNGIVQHPAISGNGRIVAFASDADNLVDGDDNNRPDVFVYDFSTGKVSRVSVNNDREEGNGTSMNPALSADGRLVAFQSLSTNLAENLMGNTFQIFLHDRQTGQTQLITKGVDGLPGNYESQQPSLSADGRFIALESWANNLVPDDTNMMSDIFVYDRQEGLFTLISVNAEGEQANHVSGGAVLSRNGRYIAFASLADNLFGGDDNFAYDVFSHDRETGQTALVSINHENKVGNEASISPTISGDGSRIVFDSMATDLVFGDDNQRADVFVLDQMPPLNKVLFIPRLMR